MHEKTKINLYDNLYDNIICNLFSLMYVQISIINYEKINFNFKL